jgi:hypothetical protein
MAAVKACGGSAVSHPDHHSGPNGRRPARDRRRRHGAQGGFPVDFLWPERRLIVGIDGYRFHRGAQAFEDDRDRDVKLKLLASRWPASRTGR